LVGTCLGPVVARQGFGTAEILTAWPEIVGHELADRTRPEKIRWPRRSGVEAGETATLVVRAEGGDALEIQHMSGEILARINGFLGWGAVGRLAVRQAPVAMTSGATSPQSPRPGRAGDAAASRENRDIDRIAEPGLRDALDALNRARLEDENNSP
jgi:hypothetical protein